VDTHAVASSDTGLDRILTIPNVLSIVRLSCIPLFLWLLFGGDDRLAAAGLLAILGATDWVDGYVARHFHQVSNLGKVLDPVADRLLLLVAVVAIAVDGSVPVWVAVLTLLRELIVGVATLVLAAMGAARIDVTWWGKAGTFGQLAAYPLFLASEADWALADAARVGAWAAVLPGLAFSYVALALYVPLAKQALRDGRVASAS
jgi:cardiolipin synthase (CMP-forming)